MTIHENIVSFENFEEVATDIKSVEGNQKWTEKVLSVIFSKCELSEFSNVLDNEDYLYAEEVLFKLSELLIYA